MASRNVRPRVLAAISELEAFTVPDLVQAAGLPDRKVAYAQLDKLSKDGWLDQKLLPPAGNHRPLTLYQLKSDHSVRKQFAAEMAGYRIPARTTPSVGLAETAVAAANAALSEIEAALDAGVREKADLTRLKDLDTQLDSARTEIGTALLEYGTAVSEEKNPAHPAIVARNRWRNLDERLKKAKAEGEVRVQVQPWLLGATAAASALVSGLGLAPALGAVIGEQFSKEMKSSLAHLAKSARPAAEMLLDELRAEKDNPWVPLLSSACRLTDTNLLLQLLAAFQQVGEPWVAYDNESAHYLVTKKVRSKEWLTAYESVRGRLCESRDPGNTRTGLYSFESGQLDPDKFMALTRNCLVSVVTNAEVPFLGSAEPVRPTLLMERGRVFETLDCEFLRPDASLYAYGPLIHDLRCFPGAPALRVAGSLGVWGVPVKQHLKAVVKTFENNQSLLVVRADERLGTSINEHVRPVLDTEVIQGA